MSQQPTPIKINGPGELVATVPYLLGYRPASSLVIVGLGNGLQCTFRVDLPELADEASFVRDLTPQLAQNACGRCVAIIYGPAPIAKAIATVTEQRLDAADIKLLDCLRVEDGRYWTVSCEGPCCPPEGQAIPELPEPVLALIAEGGVARTDRAAVSALLDPADAETRAAVAANIDATRALYARPDQAARRREFAYIEQWFEFPVLPWPAAIARLGVALLDSELRDQVLGAIDAQPDKARLDLWIWLVRHLEGDLIAGVATVAGWAAYRTGNGVLALESFDLALGADSANDHARVLLEALQDGIPPQRAAARAGIGAVDDEAAAQA